jgi:hypothetical protein
VEVPTAIAPYAEALMLACFGASWPFSVARAIRVKKVTGKSPVFLWLVLLGYAAGITFKLARWSGESSGRHWILLLYAFNFTIVAVDICLYYRYRKNG